MAIYYTQRMHFSDELFVLHLDGCLFEQYIIDVAIKIKQNIFNFLVLSQAQLRAELYQGLANMVEHDVRLNHAQEGQ
jgi:hypothetical protein